MKKIDKARVQEVIAAIPQAAFSFDDLRATITGDYDALKDVLFSLLDDPESGVIQVFDEEAHAMRFQRKAKP